MTSHHWGHLDDPSRDDWQRPDRIVALAELAAGHVVADLGAGTGYFESHFSRAVGPTGRVLALDVDPSLVEHMRHRFERAGLTNVEPRLITPDDLHLTPASVDRLVIVDVWHHLSNRVALAERLRQALAPQGRAIVVESRADGSHGHHGHRVSPAAVIDELRVAGFVARLLPELLPRHFIVVAEPAR